MKIFLFVFILLFSTIKIFGQHFSQYNTGTLYDSFENPSQRAFIPDSSRMFSFNFLVPNLNGNFLLNGDAQATLKSRYFLNMYNNTLLKLGQGQLNNVNGDANIYLFMAKLFLSFDGDEEIGFSIQSRAEGKGIFSDDAISLLNGTQGFSNNTTYPNAFNGNFYYQTYNQVSFTYKEKIDDQITVGAKGSILLGTAYSNLDVVNSNGSFNTNTGSAYLALQGHYKSAYQPSQANSSYFSPNFRNPGLAISVGTTYKAGDGYVLQGNIKDLGHIHWSGLSNFYKFNSSGTISGSGTTTKEDSVYHLASSIVHNNLAQGAFSTPIDGKAELSISKNYWINGEEIKYSPTFVASKELFYRGYAVAWVNPFQYRDYVVTLTPAYDNLNTFTMGLQFMMKTPNFEFFIGSDKIIQSLGLLGDKISHPAQFTDNPAFTGGSIFLGFSLKFGDVIEHPMNAAYVPGGFNHNGFFRNLFEKIFKKNDVKPSWGE